MRGQFSDDKCGGQNEPPRQMRQQTTVVGRFNLKHFVRASVVIHDQVFA